MAELAALNVKLNGDATDLRAALQSAEDGLENVSTQARATARQTAAAAAGTGRLATAFGRHGFAISNAANQFSDLAVQIGAGVPASRALSQQLPQMTAMMGPLATIIGVTSGILIGLAGNFLASRQQAEDLTRSLEALDRIQGDLNTANEILRMSVVDLRNEYGAYADEVLRAAQSMAILAEAEAAQRMGSALQDFSGELDRLTSTGRTFDTAMTTALARIRQQFGVTGTQARELHGLLLALETATTFDQQVEALRQIEDYMEQTGIDAARLPPELIAALQQLNQMVIASANLEGALDNAADAGARLRRSLPMSYGISLSDQGLTGETAIFGGQTGDVPISETGGGGGRGGGGRSLADQIESELETLRQGFMSQEELQLEAYARQQEILQQALDQRLVTQQEYARLMEQVEGTHQHAMAVAANDGARETLNNLATIFQGSKEIGAGIALANSWLAFTEVLKDPAFVGRPFARIAAAGAALSSGLQAVQNIKSASPGGGGGGSAGAGAASSTAETALTRPTQNVVIDMINASPSQISGIQKIVDMLAEAKRQGYDLNAILRTA
jgi:tetratricopeptide (TPR) repeat protein